PRASAPGGSGGVWDRRAPGRPARCPSKFHNLAHLLNRLAADQLPLRVGTLRHPLAGADRDRQEILRRWDRAVVMGREDAGRVVGAVEVDHEAAGALRLYVEVPHPVGLASAGRVAEVELERVRRDTGIAQMGRGKSARSATDREAEPARAGGRAVVFARRSDRDVRRVPFEGKDVVECGVVREPVRHVVGPWRLRIKHHDRRRVLMRETQAIAAGLDRPRAAQLTVHAKTVGQRLDHMSLEPQRFSHRQLMASDRREIRRRSVQPGAVLLARPLGLVARAIDVAAHSNTVRERPMLSVARARGVDSATAKYNARLTTATIWNIAPSPTPFATTPPTAGPRIAPMSRP